MTEILDDLFRFSYIETFYVIVCVLNIWSSLCCTR